ncbi:hypothetical protein SARC_06390 [Sphaeroforma arctica JP610]|uniref:Exostosin GT47 domain-containing protein n=1 Tax=Sphaeroforma arctica JP610 TaxID=667725 RepID=A0A0L0FXA5_9EUKA|nr:hypothetical protein SARC_06390 [Sphaeroforma arctica JP610]KNC81279.1 hypothetical protein SARC_06390 [Sphaeroforma arctica JP610]|eukprot:XP_014155181.1 hypothetical protein SARC_06390 [Sphaeroforma arctica JP610]
MRELSVPAPKPSLFHRTTLETLQGWHTCSCRALVLVEQDNAKKFIVKYRGSPTNDIRRNITGLHFPKNRTVILDLLDSRLAQLAPADKAYKMHVGKLEMRQSIFCICPGGLTPSSQRMFVAIAANCIPVIVSDHLQLPFEDLIDYNAFTVRIRESRVNQIPEILERYTPRRLNRLQRNLKVYRTKLLFNQPYPQEDDAFSLILDTLLRKKNEHPELYINDTIK